MQGPKIRLIKTAGMTVLFAVLAPLALFAQDGAQPAAETNPLGLAMMRQHAETFAPGQPFEVAVTISAAAAGQITAMGLRETLPPGWKLEAVAGANGAPPDVSPAPGAAGLLEFAWITVPPFPYTFTYTATPPEGDGGVKEIHGALEYREMGGAHYAAPVMTEVRGPDAKAPTITLKGDNPAALNVGDTWQEPGYTALDGKDQDISGKVVIGGTVDTSRAGEYGLTYRVSTDDGQHVAVSRTVVVKDGSAPTSGKTAAAGAVGPLREPGSSGRENSNPIAASVGSNPGNQAETSQFPMPTAAEGEAEAALKRMKLPDLSPFRPHSPEKTEDKSETKAGTAKSAPASPQAPTASPAPTQHRAPVPKEMLDSAGMEGEEQPNPADASSSGSAAQPPAPTALEGSAKTLIAAVAALMVLLGGLGLLGWRLVYSRPVRRRRPPSPPSR